MINALSAVEVKTGALAFLPLENLGDYLAGSWQLTRQVDDALSALSGKIIGEASWRFCKEGLSYVEQGVFQRPGQAELTCSQRYLYKLPTLEKAEVCFPDGRFFHDLDLRQGFWQAEHLCGADLYKGRFEVLSLDRWRMTWQIKGPRKNARLNSLFVRKATS